MLTPRDDHEKSDIGICIVVYYRDIYELYEYFYSFRRVWVDQKHRRMLSQDEIVGDIKKKRVISR